MWSEAVLDSVCRAVVGWIFMARLIDHFCALLSSPNIFQVIPRIEEHQAKGPKCEKQPSDLFLNRNDPGIKNGACSARIIFTHGKAAFISNRAL